MANDNKLVNLADLKEAFDNLNQNKKTVQTSVPDPTASGNDVSFIASISQDTQGVITATKKTIAEATTTAAGLMSAADKTKLNAAVTSVNGATGAVVLDAEDVGAVSTSDVIDIPHGGTGATTAAGACAALAPGIPTAAYTLIPNSNYGPNVKGGVEALRCVKYGNGLKRLFGLIEITGNGVSDGGIFCTVPTGFEYNLENNGGLQGWGTFTSAGEGTSYLFRFNGSSVAPWGRAIYPIGTYAINYLYF